MSGQEGAEGRPRGDGEAISIRAAQRGDVGLLLQMFAELAEYERLQAIFCATEERLADALFGQRPVAEALIAERAGQAAGYALFFVTFSSFLAQPGVWLEDIFVRPQHRRFGIGRALLAAVGARTRARGGERLEWAALDWNELALSFYRGLGAQAMSDWITHRLDGEALQRLAREADERAGGRA